MCDDRGVALRHYSACRARSRRASLAGGTRPRLGLAVVHGDSMLPTLRDGDRLLVSTAARSARATSWSPASPTERSPSSARPSVVRRPRARRLVAAQRQPGPRRRLAAPAGPSRRTRARGGGGAGAGRGRSGGETDARATPGTPRSTGRDPRRTPRVRPASPDPARIRTLSPESVQPMAPAVPSRPARRRPGLRPARRRQDGDPLDGVRSTSRDDLSLAYTPGRGPGVRGDRGRPAR